MLFLGLVILIGVILLVFNLETLLWIVVIFGFTIVWLTFIAIRWFIRLFIGESNRQEEVIKPKLMSYDNGITYHAFEDIVRTVCKPIKRIQSFKINSGIVTLNVLSQSGISEWSFILDFNDEGNFTGNFKEYSENSDSNLSETIAHKISEKVRENLSVRE